MLFKKIYRVLRVTEIGKGRIRRMRRRKISRRRKRREGGNRRRGRNQ